MIKYSGIEEVMYIPSPHCLDALDTDVWSLNDMGKTCLMWLPVTFSIFFLL